MPRGSARQPASGKRIGAERPADFDRLPARFKRYISEMEQRLSACEDLLQSGDDTNVWLEAYSLEAQRRNLPANARVFFQLPSGDVEVQIDKRRGTGLLRINSSHGGILVRPQVSNEITVEVARYE
jgi:hypothetical protein